MEAEAIDASSGGFRKRRAAQDHAKFAMFCGPKSVIRARASQEIASHSVESRNCNRAHDHDVIARSCASNSHSRGREAAAIAARSGSLGKVMCANAHSIRARRRVSNSMMVITTSTQSSSSKGTLWMLSLAIDHDKVVKPYGLISKTLALIYSNKNGRRWSPHEL